MEGLKFIKKVSLVLVLLASILISACAPTSAPASPSQTIAPTVPGTTQPPAQTVTPTQTTPTKTLSPAPAATVQKLLMLSHVAEGTGYQSLHVKNVIPKIIEEFTNGRIKIEVGFAGQIVEATQNLEAVKNGLADLANTSSGYHQGIVPVAEIEANLAFAAESVTEYWILYYDYGLKDILKEAYEKQAGVYYLTPTPSPFTVLMTTKKKMTNLSEFKGTKVLTFGPMLKFIDGMGGSGMYLPFAERYSAVATGVADGMLTNEALLYDLKMYELTKYTIDVVFSSVSCDSVFMNFKKWNSLDADLQKAFQGALSQMVTSHGGSNLKAQWKARADFLKQGQQIIRWPAEDVQKCREIAYQYFDQVASKDAYCAKAITALKSLIKDAGRMK